MRVGFPTLIYTWRKFFLIVAMMDLGARENPGTMCII
jgi:hypothetical protein